LRWVVARAVSQLNLGHEIEGRQDLGAEVG
jgi:hypothetical protein